MRRCHAHLVHSVIVVILLVTVSGPAAVAQREAGVGICHSDETTGTVMYMEVPESAAAAHQEHGDTLAPNGPDDCQATRAPVAEDDSYEAEIGVPLVVPAPGVLENDRGFTTATLVREPSWGSLEFGRDGLFTYVADREHPGTDGFAYQATNEEGYIDFSEVQIFLPTGINSPPVAVDDTFVFTGPGPYTVPAPGVLANDSDPDGDPIWVKGFTTYVKGCKWFTKSPDGSFTWLPVSGQTSTQCVVIITDGLDQAESILFVSIEPSAN